LSFYRFNEPSPEAYIIRCYNQEPCAIHVHGISGDIDKWTGPTYKTEANAYINAYIWLRKKQADELHALELVMARKGIEGYPSNNNLFLKRHPELRSKQHQELYKEIQLGLKERRK
jgi:hypothetical protein